MFLIYLRLEKARLLDKNVSYLNEIIILTRKNTEFIRFLFIGAWNTGFGYLVFVALIYSPWKLHYVIVLIISNIITITNAYLCYKFFIFKTRGNYFSEYIKSYVVYGTNFLINLALLPFFVEILKIRPVISQAMLIPLTVVISYFGHKHFSFNKKIRWRQTHGDLPRIIK